MYLFLKADATVSISMVILYTYLVSLTLFLCIYFTCIFIHMHSTRCHVLYTIEFIIIILTAQYTVYHNKVVSCIFHITFKTFCLIIINYYILTELICLRFRNKSYFAPQKQPGASYAQRSPGHAEKGFRYARSSGDETLLGHLWLTDYIDLYYGPYAWASQNSLSKKMYINLYIFLIIRTYSINIKHEKGAYRHGAFFLFSHGNAGS